MNPRTQSPPGAKTKSNSQTKAPVQQQRPAPKGPAVTKERPIRSVKEDQERSDWEGMTPKPDQQCDDVAAPGKVPEGHQ